MHWLKWLGGSLIGFCALLAGALCAQYEQKKYRQAQGFVALIRHIRSQIECYATPVAQILSTLDERMLLDCGLYTTPEEHSALLLQNELYLPAELLRELQGFFGELGGCYREEQLRCCDYYLERLAPLCTEMQEQLPKRVRLAWLLPPSFVAALALLLI